MVAKPKLPVGPVSTCYKPGAGLQRIVTGVAAPLERKRPGLDVLAAHRRFQPVNTGFGFLVLTTAVSLSVTLRPAGVVASTRARFTNAAVTFRRSQSYVSDVPALTEPRSRL